MLKTLACTAAALLIHTAAEAQSSRPMWDPPRESYVIEPGGAVAPIAPGENYAIGHGGAVYPVDPSGAYAVGPGGAAYPVERSNPMPDFYSLPSVNPEPR